MALVWLVSLVFLFNNIKSIINKVIACEERNSLSRSVKLRLETEASQYLVEKMNKVKDFARKPFCYEKFQHFSDLFKEF